MYAMSHHAEREKYAQTSLTSCLKTTHTALPPRGEVKERNLNVVGRRTYAGTQGSKNCRDCLMTLTVSTIMNTKPEVPVFLTIVLLHYLLERSVPLLDALCV